MGGRVLAWGVPRGPGATLGHVNLEVTDLRTAERWYGVFCPAIGFRAVPVTDPWWRGFRRGTVTLWVTTNRPRRTHLRRPHVPGTGAADPISNHLGFRVKDVAALRRIERTLRAKGLTPVYGASMVPTAGQTLYVSSAWEDPDHNVMEVYTVTRHSAPHLGTSRS